MKNIIAIALITVSGSIGLYIFLNYKEWDEATRTVAPLLMLLLLGLSGGILTFMYILPIIGEKFSEIMYAAGGKIEPDENSRAISKIMQGDYEGAIQEYQKLVEDKPGDVHPVWEIAKLHAERLDDPDSGIAYLEQTLRDGEWEQEGASFLMNRLADLNIEHRGDFDAARALLTQIVEIMPKTRFSANATHRIRQLEEEEVQAKLAAQRQEQQLQESGEGEEV